MTIQTAQTMLANSLRHMPRLALASLVSWLDPLHLLNLDYDDFEYDGDDLPVALLTCRLCFPGVYARSLSVMTRRATLAEVERLICDGVSQSLFVALDNIEMFKWGVPYEGLGVDLEGMSELEPEEAYPRLLPVLKWLGVSERPDNPGFGYAHDRAVQLVKSLEAYPDKSPHQDLANLLRWIFGNSGNTLVDNSDEALAESGLEPLEWTPDNIAFINEVQSEACQIVDSAYCALERLEHDTEWQTAFQQNCQLLMERSSPRVALRWPPCAGNGAPDAADP